MEVSKALCKSAQLHADDTGQHGIFGHVGSDGSIIDDRILKFVEDSEWIGENCNYNSFNHPSESVIDLVIDDGVPDRNHRDNIFNPVFNSLGVGIAKHKVYDLWVVIDYGKNVVPKNKEDGIIEFEEINANEKINTNEEINANEDIIYINDNNPREIQPRRYYSYYEYYILNNLSYLI